MPGQPASCDIGLPAASAFLALSAAFTIVSLVLLDAAFVARGMCAAAATSSSGIVVRGATLRRFRTVVLPDATANNPTAADSVSSSSVVLSPRAPAEAFAPGADDTPTAPEDGCTSAVASSPSSLIATFRSARL